MGNSRCSLTGALPGAIATIPAGKKGYVIALRTGPNMHECQKIIGSIEHFYGHLEIQCSGSLGLPSIEFKENVEARADEIKHFVDGVVLA